MLLTLATLIGFSTHLQKAWSEESVQEMNGKNDDDWVIVEPSKFVPSDVSTTVSLIPYKLRREDWGLLVSGGGSNFTPINYEPNFLQGGFDDVYEPGGFGAIDFQFSVKYNFSLGSLSLDLGVGTYQAISVNPDLDSRLSVMPIRIGASYYMDNLFFEPYVVPYVSGGGYVMNYREELTNTGTSFNGFTQIAPYAAAGLQFQIDWIDQLTATNAFAEAGIENTFLFVEGRKYFASQNPADPDFETDIFVLAGLRVEF